MPARRRDRRANKKVKGLAWAITQNQEKWATQMKMSDGEGGSLKNDGSGER